MQNIVVRFKLAIPSLSRNMSARQFRGPAFLRYFLSKVNMIIKAKATTANLLLLNLYLRVKINLQKIITPSKIWIYSEQDLD